MSYESLRLAAIGFAVAASLPTSAAFAAANDFRFELLSAQPAGPGKTDVTLRLAHLPDAKPVAGAIIFQPKAVMTGMEDMPGAATVQPGQQPGTYVLRVATSMAGPWTLQLSAKVQGEAETVRASVAFQAAE